MSFWDTSSDGLEWRQFLCRASLRPTERPSRYNSTLGEPSYGRCTLLQVQILAASRPDFNRAIAIQQFSKCSLWEKNKALDPPTFHCCSTIQSALSRPPATVPVTEAETRKWWKDGCKIGYLPQSSQPAQSDFASWNDAKSSVGMQKQALNMTIFRDVGCPLIFRRFSRCRCITRWWFVAQRALPSNTIQYWGQHVWKRFQENGIHPDRCADPYQQVTETGRILMGHDHLPLGILQIAVKACVSVYITLVIHGRWPFAMLTPDW